MQQHGSKFFATYPPHNPRGQKVKIQLFFRTWSCCTWMQQHGSNYFVLRPPSTTPPTSRPGVVVNRSKFNFFSEHDHDAYLKGITNAAKEQIFCPRPAPHTTLGVKVQFCEKMVMLHFKLKGITKLMQQHGSKFFCHIPSP